MISDHPDIFKQTYITPNESNSRNSDDAIRAATQFLTVKCVEVDGKTVSFVVKPFKIVNGRNGISCGENEFISERILSKT